jgi:hypothetical protein
VQIYARPLWHCCRQLATSGTSGLILGSFSAYVEFHLIDIMTGIIMLLLAYKFSTLEVQDNNTRYLDPELLKFWGNIWTLFVESSKFTCENISLCVS